MVSEAAHRVLVAESDEGVRELIVELLEDRGLHCSEAANTDAAILMLQNHAFDAVIADLTLFASHRQVFIEALSAHPPATQLLLISGGNNELLGAGDSRFPLLQKPFRARRFLRAVEQLLQGRRDLELS